MHQQNNEKYKQRITQLAYQMSSNIRIVWISIKLAATTATVAACNCNCH